MNDNKISNKVDRQKHWKNYLRGLDNVTPEKKNAAYKYFFNGGIVELLESNLAPNDYGTLIHNSPANTLEELIREIVDYYFWFTEDAPRTNHRHRYHGLIEMLNTGYSYFFTSPALNFDVAVDCFKWLYGAVYSSTHSVNFVKNGKVENVNISVDPNEMSFDLISHLSDHFWRKERRNRLSAFRVKDYFYSVYPHMDEICFSIEIPEEEDFEHNGKAYRKAWVEFNHRFIALLNGYITDFETFEEIEEWHCYDLEGLEIFKEELAKVKMPSAYYKLEEYILSFEKGHIFELAW